MDSAASFCRLSELSSSTWTSPSFISLKRTNGSSSLPKKTMKTLLLDLKTSIIATIVLVIICSGLYPLVIWGIGQVIFPFQANGSLIEAKDGTIVGSALLAQGFSGEKYFHPRPSAAGTGYDPTASGGSSLGPTSQKLIDQIKQNVEG